MRPIHPSTSARRELTNRGRLAAEGDGHFGHRHVEDVVEKESGPLQRGQTLEGQQQRDRDVVGDCLVRLHGIHERIRQPWSDVGFRARPRGAASVEAQPCDNAG